MSFKEIFTKLCAEKGESPTTVCKRLGYSNAVYSQWTDDTIPRNSTLIKIADYFGVTVDYLLGKTDQKEKHQENKTTDEDIKVALFGGDEEVTDEMWEEVKNFVAFVKGKNKK